MAITAGPLLDEEEAPLSVLTADTIAAIEQLRADARAAAEASRAPSSERAYAADWRDFCAFTARIGRARLPAEAETVALYVADLTRRGRRPATIARKLAAIAVYHRSLDHPTPTDHDVVRAVVRGTRRQLGVAQPQKTALELDALRTVVLGIPTDLRGLRDRALLLVGWTAALRRSELVALEVGDLSFEPEGVVLTIRRSKTDREGAGATVAVPFGAEEATCPVGALRRWLETATLSEGRVFRRIDRHGHLGPTLSDRALAEIVAACAGAVGLEGDFAGLVAVAILSTLWSDDALLTLRRSFGLLGTTTIAFYVVCRYSLPAFLDTLTQTIIIIALGSIIAIVAAPDFGVMQGAYQGAWRGLFWEKNRFGESMAVGILSTLLLAKQAPGRKLALWLTIATCTVLMLGSRSATAIVGVAAALGTLVLVRRLKNSRVGFRSALVATGLLVLTLCAGTIGFEPQDAFNVLGRDATLTGRTQIWSTAIQYIGDRPLLGYGYQVFWEPDGPVRRYLAKDLGWEPVTAHDGYLEIGLDFGLVGLSLFVIFLIEAVRRSIAYLRADSEPMGAWPFLVIAGLAVMNLADANFVLYNEFLWVIFMVAFLYTPSDLPERNRINDYKSEYLSGHLAIEG